MSSKHSLVFSPVLLTDNEADYKKLVYRGIHDKPTTRGTPTIYYIYSQALKDIDTEFGEIQSDHPDYIDPIASKEKLKRKIKSSNANAVVEEKIPGDIDAEQLEQAFLEHKTILVDNIDDDALASIVGKLSLTRGKKRKTKKTRKSKKSRKSRKTNRR